uniref:RNA-dependent RNA polymerase n=1 Tax=Panagrolaimus sp. ES5 TaxID=591445 RepID=A0AC34EZN7_9BILA
MGNGFQEPPDSLIFDLEQCKVAPLVCHTPFLTEFTLSTGFKAENKFYKTNEFRGHSSEWIHDNNSLQFEQFFDKNEDSLSVIFRYDSFKFFNLNVKNIAKRFWYDSETFEVKILFVTPHAPIFKYRIWNSEKGSYEYGRYFGQHYRNSVRRYWNDMIQATAFQITYEMDKNVFYSWIRKIIECLPCTVTFNKIDDLEYGGQFNPSSLNAFLARMPSKAKFFVDCIQSVGIVGEYLLEYFVMFKYDIEMLKEFGKTDKSELIDNYFYSLYKFLKLDITLPSLNFDSKDVPEKISLGTKYSAIKTVIITPVTMRFELDENVINNRAFRRLGPENILQAKYCDDDKTLFPRDDDILYARMYLPLINGIRVGGKQYYDFGSSSSLFRDHGTYLYQAESQKEIVKMINEWAIFKQEPPAKVAARLGLMFSSATEIQLKLRNNELGPLPEHVSHASDVPQYTFSDGVGVIDIQYAREIQAELGLLYTPSAFQFRCLGFKGMVTVDLYNESLVTNGGPYVLMLRDSQKKFNAVHELKVDFDVIMYSTPCPLKLHRSFIALLVALAREQGKWDTVERRLHELFNLAFVDIIKSLYDKNAFAKALGGLPKYFPINYFHPDDLIQQPFLRSLVEIYAVSIARQLFNKCQIPLPEHLGRNAPGVLDETGLLKPDQIFFRYSKDTRSKSFNPEYIVHTGPVGVTKSPMYHLGDIRYLEAVDIPELRYLKDVVVFPNHGKRSIPDQIGGGDLDGDVYSVFWDPDLLLKHSEAADFLSPDSSHLQTVTVEELHQSHAAFRIDYEKFNNLEQISNLFISHLALHPPGHPEVEKLSLKADDAVNSFKSGIFAEAIEWQEKPIFFPSFLNKRHEPMFGNSHILNQLHKRCSRIYMLIQLAHVEATKERLKQNKKKIEAAGSFSMNMFKKYKMEITDLMEKFNANNEAEIFVAVTLDPPGTLSTTFKRKKDEEATAAMIHAYLTEIVGRYRKKILDKFKPDWESDMRIKDENISTYLIPQYQIPKEMYLYAKEFSALAENDGKCLSFPYLMCEALNFNTFHTNGSMTNLMNELINDYASYTSEESLEESLATESILINAAFNPATNRLSSLSEMVINYPSFVISIPSYYSDTFKDGLQILKNISGCTDIAIRHKKTKKSFHHFTLSCDGTMLACQKLEKLLTPVVEYDPSMNTSFDEIRKRKTQAMKDILKSIFGPPPPPPSNIHHLHHSRTY